MTTTGGPQDPKSAQKITVSAVLTLDQVIGLNFFAKATLIPVSHLGSQIARDLLDPLSQKAGDSL